LTGRGGDDTYIVYGAAGVIVEIAGEGHDRLASGVDFVFTAGVSVEYLNTTSLTATSAIDLTGNEIGQWVRGNDGANVLDGGGGIDTLFGMGGTDVFRFSTALGAGNVDRIDDFSVTDDQIHLDDAIFTALSVGGLDASAFKDIALGARDADDRILYNSDTGSLFYDADGSGGAFTPIKFATVSPGLSLSAADFVVV
jgi:serralysin